MKALLSWLLTFFWRMALLSIFIVMPHELGHYAMFRYYDVRVVQIAVGFGPTIASHTMSNGVVLSLKPILLGGFTEPAVTGPHNALLLGAPQLTVVFLAGMVTNLLLAYLGLLYLGLKVMPRPNWAKSPWFMSMPHAVLVFVMAFKQTFVDWVLYPWRMLRRFVATVRGRDSAPIVPVVQVTEEPSSFTQMVMVFVVFNIILAQFNLLPFEPLDGGNALSLVFRMVFGPWAEHLVDRWSMALFGLLMILNAFFGARNDWRRKKKRDAEEETALLKVEQGTVEAQPAESSKAQTEQSAEPSEPEPVTDEPTEKQ